MDQGVGELLILNKTKFTQDLRPRVLFSLEKTNERG